VEVTAVDDAGRVHLTFVGACDGCFLRPMTLAATIAPAISRIDGVAGIVVKGMVVSPRTLAFVHERLSKERA
jgi:Fe-S cluster biogenesis protein NfuA